MEHAVLFEQILRVQRCSFEVFEPELILEIAKEVVDGCFVFQARNGRDKNIVGLLHTSNHYKI